MRERFTTLNYFFARGLTGIRTRDRLQTFDRSINHLKGFSDFFISEFRISIKLIDFRFRNETTTTSPTSPSSPSPPSTAAAATTFQRRRRRR